MSDLVTLRELSDRLGGLVAERTLRDWVAQGILMKAPRGARGKGDAWEWTRQIVAYLQGKGSEQTDALRDAKIRSENARALRLEMLNAENAGQLVRAGDVSKVWAAAFGVCKQRLLASNSRLLDELEGITDRLIVKEILDAAVYEALEELGGGGLVEGSATVEDEVEVE